MKIPTFRTLILLGAGLTAAKAGQTGLKLGGPTSVEARQVKDIADSLK